MPQARSGGSRRSSSSSGSPSKRSSSGSRSTRATSSRSGSTSRGGTSSRSRSTSGRARSAGTRSTSARAATGDARVDAAAQRIRKLNEQIIEAGKEAGEATLTSYEKALKTIAGAIERGPGSSDVEWVSNLATAQAKFIRDMTAAWTSAARKMLK